MAKREGKKNKKSPPVAELSRLQSELQRITVRLESCERELAESTDQQTATSEVSSAIARAAVELPPVYQAILANTTRLCEAHIAALFLYNHN